MRRELYPTLAARGLAASAGLLGAMLLTAIGGVANGEPVYWGQRDLAIPYRAATATAAGLLRPVLYVSRDNGATWAVAAEAGPQAQSFVYRAPAEGPYAFAVRVYDSLGRAAPGGPLRPEMTVVIDTTRPALLAAHATHEQASNQRQTIQQGGLVRFRVSASDNVAVAGASLQGYLRLPGEPHWRPIAWEATPADAADPRLLQRTGKLRLERPATTATLRLALADRAGNRAEATQTIAIRPEEATGDRLVQAPASVSDPFQMASMRLPSPRPSTPTPASPRSREWGPAADRPRRSGWRSGGPMAPLPAERAVTQAWPPEPRRVASPVRRSSAGGSTPFRQASLAPSPSVGPHRGREALVTARGAVDRVVGSERFEFDYQVDSTGKWGVSAVELWGTDDAGASWRRFAVDSDLRSPIHVQTPGEGDYGFRLLVTSVGGLDPVTPRPGDRPEVTVRVDTKRPAVAITGVQQGDGYFADQLSIAWTADDENPADQSIDLSYAARPTGPWMPIASGLANTGRYDWRLQRHLPRSLYVRLQARDAGGNVATAVHGAPIVIDMPTPAGSLLGVRPRD